MRIRTAKFAMIPMWVIRHQTVQRNATRIAVYAGLQAAAWEAPDNEWRSTREMAVAVAEITGISSETCRKHLSALVKIGAIIKTDDEVILPADAPGLGRSVGPQQPTTGSPATQESEDTTTREKGLNKTPTVGTTVAHRADERGRFEEFWKLYPRRVGKRAAVKAWDLALKRADLDPVLTPAELIMAAVRARAAWWSKARTPADKIPHAATWLNRDGWLDELEPTPTAAAASTAQAAADLAGRLRDEVDRAIHDGDAELAWRLTRSRARGRGDHWFDEIAQAVDTGRRDSITLHAVKRDDRPITIADIEQVRAAKAALWEACDRSVSSAIGQSSSPTLEGPP